MFNKIKEKMTNFTDGLVNVQNAITNRRNVLNQNIYLHKKIDDAELRQIYKGGLGSKIVRIKSGYALNGTIKFATKGDEVYFNNHLRKEVKRASKFMVGFGRGIIVNYYHNDDLERPLNFNRTGKLKVRAFAGDEVSVSQYEGNFHSDRYNKPIYYMINGHNIHYTRVVDFTYVEPPEDDMATYNYGGISEFEMIYKQIISDGIVERASANIVEKNASLFYKIKNFKDDLSTKRDSAMIEYFSLVEDYRSNNGATLMDADDIVEVHAQNLTNLKEISELTLRRLAMVTGIPMPMLVGENVKGLNSTGDNERQIFQDTIETIQSEYLLEPLQQLFDLHDMGDVEFKENQGDTPQARIAYEKEVIANALQLYQMGEDYGEYLNRHDVIRQESYDKFFEKDEESEL